MTVQRSQSSSTDNATRELDSARDRPRDKVRDQPDKDTVDRFRNLMDKPKGKEEGLLAKKPGEDKLLQGKQDGKEPQADASEAAADSARLASTDDAVQRRDDRGGGDGGGDGMPPAELAALMQAQVLAREAPAVVQPQQAAQAGNPQAALADLLEKHVRQMAVSPGGAHADEGQVLLRLSDDTLPGTDLLLSKVEGGWVLRADVNSRSSYDAIREAAPGLAERFKAKNLGTLQVDPVLHG